MKEALMEDNRGEIMRILDTETTPIDADNMMSSPGLWEYSRPLTLPRVQNRQQVEVS